jgi:starch-binding outer membrane protein, SusD/RagB family
MRFARFSDRFRAAAGATLVALGAAGCGALDTQNPNIIDASNLDSPAGAATKRLGAINQFILAKDGDFNPVPVPGSSPPIYNDNSDGHILLSGILADEFVNPGFIPTRSEIDLRQAQPTNVTVEDFYRSLHRARASTEDAAASLAKFSQAPDADTGIPEMLSLSGFTYVMFAEDFCSGVPVSRVVNDTISYGDQLTTTQVLDTAIVRFNAALAHPSIAAGDPIFSLASVGLARALLNEGRFAEAAAAAQNVPADFLYETQHAASPSSLQNSVNLAWSQGNFGTEDAEGGNGLNWITANDSRVQGATGIGADNNTPTWKPNKYPDVGSSIPTADYLEAQLIIAENELQTAGGNFGPMNTRLNTLRASAGLTALPVPANAAAATDQLFRERGFWLFARGNRLGDLRRLIRQYGRGSETVFPHALYFKGGQTYGAGVNLPLPRTETNNPKVKECLDRNA